MAMVKCQTIADALYIKDLMESEDDSNKMNPGTAVHDLVEELIKYIK